MYYSCDPISPESGKALTDYIRVLDLKRGMVAKHYLLESHDGRKTCVESLKFLSRSHPSCGLLQVRPTPLNYSGVLELENITDVGVTNFMDFPAFASSTCARWRFLL